MRRLDQVQVVIAGKDTRSIRAALKLILRAACLLLVFPIAALSGFGRSVILYQIGAHLLAFAPSLPGSYLRVAFYRQTLRRCAPSVVIELGSYCPMPNVEIEEGVHIGSYCVISAQKIGRGTHIASHVSIVRGSRGHVRRADGSLADGTPEAVVIGNHCWIGEGARIAANVGDYSTVAMGACVVRPVQPNTIVGGVPAKTLSISSE